MSDLTNGQRIALETFLSEFDEPTSEERSTFDILIEDIESNFENYTSMCVDFADWDLEHLVNYIKNLANQIDGIKKC